MGEELWFLLDLNPEPWAVGPLGVSRREGQLRPFMGRNQQLDAYKNAVKDELLRQTEPIHASIGRDFPLEPGYDLHFYFWRNRADYEGSSKQVRKNQADGTNMMKATEDALQGVLITNDREVRSGRWTIVAQGPDVRGAVAVRVRWGLPELQETDDVPVWVLATVDQYAHERPMEENANAWPPKA